MSKHAVRRSFDRAAASYDAAANLQRQVCQLLLAELAEPAPARILDAGCGTGYALGLLAGRWPGAKFVAADFAPGMVAAAGGGRFPGICADIEALPFAAASFDLYWSSLSFQWCDTGRAVAEAARVLAPGGRLAVSSLAPGTLAELQEAFAGTDRHRHVLEFPPAAALAAACATAGLADARLERRTLRFHHGDLAALLRELKALGANQVGAKRRPGLMGRAAWQTVERRYEAWRTPAGLPATFEVVLCTASKPTS
ncbi:MAG: malonyl-ACP O-methyltransferase BioC [Rhodocyclales bacterium]|nr:malonyl-ACP O-methyltransferase BioC [Rhodocyclales bacterium]